MRNMPLEKGYEKGAFLENGVEDGGEKPYIFPGVKVVEVVSTIPCITL